MTRPDDGHRCPTCRMLAVLCLCKELQALREQMLPLKTELTFVMHVFEYAKPSNTVRLMRALIPESNLALVGSRDGPETIPLHKNSRLLFPDSSARPLSPEMGPLHLVIPDGTWQQAKRMTHRHPQLMGLPRVKVAAPGPSRYKLRKNQRTEGLCTLEAVAQALTILGEPTQVQETMEAALALMVARVLESRAGGDLRRR